MKPTVGLRVNKYLKTPLRVRVIYTMKPIKSLRVIVQLKPKNGGTSQNTNVTQLNQKRVNSNLKTMQTMRVQRLFETHTDHTSQWQSETLSKYAS